jgi:hypothetical protein
VPDAKPEVFLSLAQPRETAYRQLDLWLDDHLSSDTTDTTDTTEASTPSEKG